MQLLAAGATFPLRFDLVIGRPRDGDMKSYRQALLSALATALTGWRMAKSPWEPESGAVSDTAASTSGQYAAMM